MNAIEWMNSTAAFMAQDRPDLYSKSEAVLELDQYMNFLRTQNGNASVGFASYILARVKQDGFEEFLLTRKISTLAIFEYEGDVEAYAHDPLVDLPWADEDM